MKYCPACAAQCPRDYLDEWQIKVTQELCKEHRDLDISEVSIYLDELMIELQPTSTYSGRTNFKKNFQ